MPTTLKLSRQEGSNSIPGPPRVIPCRQAEDIGIIMLPGSTGTKSVMTQGGPYSLNLIGDNAHPDAGVTDQDTAVKITVGDASGRPPGNVGVVNGISCITANILTAMPHLDNQLDNRLLQA